MVDEGRMMEMGLPGSAVFGSVHHIDSETGEASSIDLFASLNNLVAAMESGDGDGIRSAMSKVESGHEHMIVQEASLGSRMGRVDSLQQIMESRDFTFQQLQSQMEDLDYVEAASRLKNQSLALQAGQQSFAQISGLNLFQYIR
jgi:flagellar hook-associated protein 3 FlgL